MKTIKEDLEFEELKTLLNGGIIDFYEDDNIKLKITGNNFKDCNDFKFILSLLNMTDKEFYLMQNILDRYNNEEYWDIDILNNTDYDEVNKK